MTGEMLNKIIYIHGFASSGNSFKGNLLRDFYGERVLTPSLLSKPAEDLAFLNKLISAHKDPVLVGSSLGGFYAEYFSRLLGLKALLINPLTRVEDIEPFIGYHEYFETGKKFIFSTQDFNTLINMSETLKISKNKKGQRIILVAENDDVIPYGKAVSHFNGTNEELKVFPYGGHSFNCQNEIINNMKLILF